MNTENNKNNTIDDYVFGCDSKLENGMSGKGVLYQTGNEVRLRVCPAKYVASEWPLSRGYDLGGGEECWRSDEQILAATPEEHHNALKAFVNSAKKGEKTVLNATKIAVGHTYYNNYHRTAVIDYHPDNTQTSSIPDGAKVLGGFSYAIIDNTFLYGGHSTQYGPPVDGFVDKCIATVGFSVRRVSL